ncbi:hypothetical protein D3C71_2037920 [compost metagenome]
MQLHVTDRHALQPVATGFMLLDTIRRNYEDFRLLPPLKEGSRPFIDLLCGEKLYGDDTATVDVPAMLEQFRTESQAFTRIKKQYHLY